MRAKLRRARRHCEEERAARSSEGLGQGNGCLRKTEEESAEEMCTNKKIPVPEAQGPRGPLQEGGFWPALERGARRGGEAWEENGIKAIGRVDVPED